MSDVRVSTEDYEKCKDEFAAFRNANRAAARAPEYFRWRYRERPNAAEPVIVCARDSSGDLAGALSVIPHHYHVCDAVSRLGVLGDISVSEKYRGKGVARKMFALLPGLKAVKDLAGCMVIPNEDAMRPLERSGWVTATKLERHVKLLNTREIIARRSSRKISTLVSPALDFLLRLAVREPRLSARKGFSGAPAAGFDGRFDELWAAVDKKGMVLGLRNRDYLTWRFTGHPVEKYGVYTLTHGQELRGYIVFHCSGGACHIDDFLCLREDGGWEHLLTYFIGHVRKTVDASKIIINCNPAEPSLGKFGFFKSPDILNLMVLAPGAAPGALSEGGRWFITAGDKDV